MAIIETKDLTRDFDNLRAVDKINLQVKEKSIFGFLGLNGAGKTTTLKMLTTLLSPTSGSAMVGGYDISNPLEIRELIGVVEERNTIPKPTWNPTEYLDFFGRLHGMPQQERIKKANILLKDISLEKFKGTPIGTFSSGMKKKVEICRALLHDPEILFLDEPTKELDIPSKREIWNLLKRLNKTIFICSHDILEIGTLCEEICVICKGRITFSGNINELRKSDSFRAKIKHDPNLLDLLAGLNLKTEVENGYIYCTIPKEARPNFLKKIANYEMEEFVPLLSLEGSLSNMLRG